MAVRTFQSRWGDYRVTEVELACKPEPNPAGCIEQSVMRIRTNDMSETCTVASWVIFLNPDGSHYTGLGHSFTTTKEEARKHYLEAIKPTDHKVKVNWVYSLKEPWIVPS
jgi:hypothetical protein